MEEQHAGKRKYRYYHVSGLPDNWQWCYSAKALQKELTYLTGSLVLKKVYVSLDSYLEATRYSKGTAGQETCLNLSFIGGYTLLLFDKLAIAFALHVEGMVEYSIFSPDQITIEEKFDYKAERWQEGCAELFELKDYFEEKYNEKRVVTVEVHGTDTWGFRQEGFDTDRADLAAEARDLPERIVFHLENEVQVKLICDDLEYCYIVVEKAKHFKILEKGHRFVSE